MKTRIFVRITARAAFAALALLVGTALAQNQPVFTTLDYPGAVLTNAWGINPGGDIVGVYTDTAGHQHGFLLSGGQFTSIDYPGAIATEARGISPSGDIVGSYTNSPGGLPNVHGFTTSNGTFTQVQFPGYLGSIAQRIMPNGTIFGCNHNVEGMGDMHGIVRTATGNYGQLDVPASMNNGSTPSGNLIVGLYTDLDTGLTHGYFLKNANFGLNNGTFEPFDVPGSNLTKAWDINPAKEVVGEFRDSAGKTHGFLLSNGAFTTIDPPGAIFTKGRGINAGGDIVGLYIDSKGKQHGFLRTSGRLGDGEK